MNPVSLVCSFTVLMYKLVSYCTHTHTHYPPPPPTPSVINSCVGVSSWEGVLSYWYVVLTLITLFKLQTTHAAFFA
jgi:hypothetical protein